MGGGRGRRERQTDRDRGSLCGAGIQRELKIREEQTPHSTPALTQAQGSAREVEACHTLAIIKAKAKSKFGSVYDWIDSIPHIWSERRRVPIYRYTIFCLV